MFGTRFAIYLYALLLIPCLLATSAQATPERLILQLKWLNQYQFAGFYAAKEMGYYQEEGLTVEIRQRELGTSPIEQVVAGEAHFGISDSSLILHRLQGKPVVALAAIYQHSPLVLLTLASKQLLGPDELRGKKVMMIKDYDDAVIVAMFNEQGMTTDDFTVVPQNFDLESLITGKVDAFSAYITDQPYEMALRNLPVNIINPANYGIDFYGDILFTSEEFITQYPDTVLAFRRASLKGWEYALNHPKEAIKWISERYQSQKSINALTYEAQQTYRMIRPELIELGHINLNRFNRIASIYKEQGLVPTDSTIKGLHYQQQLRQPDQILAYWGTLSALALLVVLLLIWRNRGLKKTISHRSEELSLTRAELEQYSDIVDRYTISFQVDLQGHFTHISTGFCSALGYQAQVIRGTKCKTLLHPANSEQTLSTIKEAMLDGQSWHGELSFRHANGQQRFIEASIDPVANSEKQVNGFAVIGRDVSDRKALETLSITDTLTGLNNRLRLDEVTQYELRQYHRTGKPLSLILFDIDLFKKINDAHGHQAGDSVLLELAGIAAAAVRQTDTIGRWGGEEFLVICPGTPLSGAVNLAEKLRVVIAEHSFPVTDNLTCSFGVVELQSEQSYQQFFESADKALYRAKENGRNQVCAATKDDR